MLGHLLEFLVILVFVCSAVPNQERQSGDGIADT